MNIVNVSVHHRLFISMPRRGSLATISNLHKSSIPCVSFTAVAAAVASIGLSVGDCEPFVKDEMSFLD